MRQRTTSPLAYDPHVLSPSLLPSSPRRTMTHDSRIGLLDGGLVLLSVSVFAVDWILLTEEDSH